MLNEAAGIRAALEALAPLRARGHEVIVVDGGSEDGTAELARGAVRPALIVAPRGRALQMNAGARAAERRRSALPACRYASASGRRDADR